MSEDIRFLDEEISALGGHRSSLYCDECGNRFEVRDDIASEMTFWKAQAGDPIVCAVCSAEYEIDFLKAIFIDKAAKHHRCPACNTILWTMSDGHILSMSISLLSEIEADRLPANFDPDYLPLKYCKACQRDAAVEASEVLWVDL